MMATCDAYPDAKCEANYCGGCNAEFFLDGEMVDCEETCGCPDMALDLMVCGTNGVTYNSACEAECAGVDYTIGACIVSCWNDTQCADGFWCQLMGPVWDVLPLPIPGPDMIPILMEGTCVPYVTEGGECFDSPSWLAQKCEPGLLCEEGVCVAEAGTCMCPGLPPDTFGICVEMCMSDSDCGDGQLCCSNGCGHVCMDAVCLE